MKLGGPTPVARLELRVVPGEPAYARANRPAIDAAFSEAKRTNPTLYNGGFFLFENARIEAGALKADARPTDYAAFLHWRAADFPAIGAVHCFPVGAMVTSDRQILLGMMGRQTTNAGRMYPPSGSFDPTDVVDGRLDAIGNIVREIREETGLAVDRAAVGRDWIIIPNGEHRFALVTLIEVSAPAADLVARVRAFIRADPKAELAWVDAVGYRSAILEADFARYVWPLVKTVHKRDLAAGHPLALEGPPTGDREMLSDEDRLWLEERERSER